MSGKKHVVKVGESRSSQLLYTFGVGALIDLPKLSVLVMGLEDWKNRHHCRKVSEERLLKAVQNELGEQVENLLVPPHPDLHEALTMDSFAKGRIGVPVAPFPRYLRCPACNLLAPISSPLVEFKKDLFRAERNRYVHINCQRGKSPVMLPVRFLVACEHGHLDDFPWRLYVHKGPTDCMGRLELRELGASGEPSALEIRCLEKGCGARRSMAEALSRRREVLPRCRGRRPHLRDFAQDGCGLPVRTILLASTNSWFSDTMTVLSVPVSSDPLSQLIEAQWPTLQHVTAPEILSFMRNSDQLGQLAAHSNEDIFASIQKKKQGGTDKDEPDIHDLKLPEWEVLSCHEEAKQSEDFHLREVAAPQGYEDVLEKVVLAERLRAVTALLGFTRIASPRDFIDDPQILQSRRAPLSRGKPDFVPATEVRGEGIFLKFDEGKIRKWCEEAESLKREEQFERAYGMWREARGLPQGHGFPEIRYILLHSFSHALMRQLSLSCGYSAASLKERIYARDVSEEGGPMAGILIFTAAADSEGTLGGLVSLGETKRLGGYIQQALEEMRLCASDPLCAEHDPAQDDTTLHGAACHACLFAPETSCERGNLFLDRTLLVDTIASSGRAFFKKGE